MRGEDLGMRNVAALVAVLAMLSFGTAAEASIARHSQVQAERNILHAHRVLRRLDPRLVNVRTGLPKTDTTVACRGRGRSVAKRWPRFVCTISYHRVHVLVLYLAQSGNGFELRRLRAA